MKYIKKFESFKKIDEEFVAAEPAPAPNTTPAPTKTPSKSPSKRPGRPSPIRRDKPAVTPDPKAEKDMEKATEKDVIQKFAKLTDQKIDI